MGLLSCRSTKQYHEITSGEIYFTDTQKYRVLKPEVLDEPLLVRQMIHGYFQNNEHTMLAVLNCDSNLMSMTLLSPIGNTLYEISFNGEEVETRGLSAFASGDPFYVLADIQYCYFPEDVLANHLADSGITMEVESLDDGWIRHFSVENELILEVKREGRSVRYINYLRNYEYMIEEIQN